MSLFRHFTRSDQTNDKTSAKANYKRAKGKNILLTDGKTGFGTSPELVHIYCLIDLKVLAR